jgi:hypothetical protein
LEQVAQAVALAVFTQTVSLARRVEQQLLRDLVKVQLH